MGVIPDKPSTVYAIRSRTTGKIYIGCTCDLRTRIPAHFSELKNGNKLISNYPDGLSLRQTEWQKDFNKYGKDDFEIYVLESDIPLPARASREDFWIKKYRARDPRFGYNARPAKARKPFEIEPGMPPLPKDDEAT